MRHSNRNYKNQNNNVEKKLIEKEIVTNSNKVQIVDDTDSNHGEPIVEKVIEAKVINGNLNLRSSKNNIDDKNIITTIPDNEIVTVIEKPSAKKPGWSKVNYNNKVGFVMDQFLKYI